MKTKLHLTPRTSHLALALLLLSTINYRLSTFAQGTAFTYQGRLDANGVPANGSYDLQFVLYAAASGGSSILSLQRPATSVSNGLFTVSLEYGANFPGAARWLEIAVTTNGGSIFTILTPRQRLTPAPYAITASNLSGELAATQLTGTLPSAVLGGTYSGSLTFLNAANNFNGFGDGLTHLNASELASGTVPDARLSANIARANQVWRIGGNAGTSTDFIGTTDDQPFDVRVNNTRVMRYRLTTDGTGNFTNAPNVIGGSPVNLALINVVGATIAGGGGNESVDGTALINKVSANFGTIGGGGQNLSSALGATVGGGVENSSSGNYATVTGGFINTAGGAIATVSGGYNNTANGDYATVAGGYGNTAGGDYAAVPGGRANAAAANHSFAAGNRAKAIHQGSFVWADSRDFDFPSVFGNGFFVRCTSGSTFATAIDSTGEPTSGVHLFAAADSWSSISDRNAKKNFSPVNAEAVLEKLAAMPVQSWNYKWESNTNTPHLGPMAQDFKAAFYPGRDDKSISTLEFDGVELAAIQGLNEKLERALKDKDLEIQQLKRSVADLQKLVSQMPQTKAK